MKVLLLEYDIKNKDEVEYVNKKSFDFSLEGFKQKRLKSNSIMVGVKRNDVSVYLGPLEMYRQNGKGIKYFKETKTFVEGEFVKDYLYGNAHLIKVKGSIRVYGKWEKDILKGKIQIYQGINQALEVTLKSGISLMKLVYDADIMNLLLSNI